MAQNVNDVIAVTGASGELGSRIAARVAETGAPLIAVGRNLSYLSEQAKAQRRGPAEYSDGAAMRQALEGASTLVLVSGRLSGRRLEEHATVLKAAISVGVKRVLYVSLLGAGPTGTYRNTRDHWLTEQLIAASGVRYTIFRAGWYAATLAGLANEDFVIRLPAGDGRTSFIGHDDLAAVLAAAATDSSADHDGRIFDVTGRESLSVGEATARIAAATGQPYSYRAETVDEAFVRRARLGMSGDDIEGWISWSQAIALGHVDTVSDTVRRFTGKHATPVEQLNNWYKRDFYIDRVYTADHPLKPLL